MLFLNNFKHLGCKVLAIMYRMSYRNVHRAINDISSVNLDSQILSFLLKTHRTKNICCCWLGNKKINLFYNFCKI